MVPFRTYLETFLLEQKKERKKKPFASLCPDKDVTYRFKLTDDGTGLVQCDPEGVELEDGIRITSDRDNLSRTFLDGDRATKTANLLTKYKQFKKKYPENEKNFEWYCRNVFGFKEGKSLTGRKYDTDKRYELGHGDKVVFKQINPFTYYLDGDILKRPINRATVKRIVEKSNCKEDILYWISHITRKYVDRNGDVVSFKYLGNSYYTLDGTDGKKKFFRDFIDMWTKELTQKEDVEKAFKER